MTGFTPIEGSLGGKWVEAEGDRAARGPSHLAVQPGNGEICRRLPEPLQSRRCVPRRGSLGAPGSLLYFEACGTALGDTDVAGLNGLFGAIAPPAESTEETGESGQSLRWAQDQRASDRHDRRVDARLTSKQLTGTVDAMQIKDASFVGISTWRRRGRELREHPGAAAIIRPVVMGDGNLSGASIRAHGTLICNQLQKGEGCYGRAGSRRGFARRRDRIRWFSEAVAVLGGTVLTAMQRSCGRCRRRPEGVPRFWGLVWGNL